MSEEMNGKIESRLKEVKENFDKFEQERVALVNKRNELVEQIRTADRRLSEIQASQINLQGRHSELTELVPKKQVPKLEIPKEKPKEKAKKKK